MATSDFLGNVPPELLARVLRTGQLGTEEEALRQRLERGQALQEQAAPRYSNPWAAALGGLAGVVRTGGGAYQEVQARKGLEALGKERTAGREALLGAYTGGIQRQQITAPDVVAPSIGMPDATPEQMEIADVLRGKQQQEREEATGRGTAYLGLLSGDPALAQFGKAFLGEDTRLQRLGLTAQRAETADEALDIRRDALLQRALELEEARKARAEAAQIQRDFQAEQNELNRISRERAASLMAGQKSTDTTEKQTKDFGEEIVKSGAPSFYVRYDVAKSLLSKYKGDLPGFGRIEGRLPDEAISTDGRELRQAVGQLLSEYRKGQTGAGMSDTERAEYGRITGLLQTGDEQSVRQGVDALKRAIDERVRATAGAYRPEAVRAYAERVPRVGAALALPPDAAGQPTAETPTAPTPTGKRVTMPDGTAYDVMSDGSTRKVQ